MILKTNDAWKEFIRVHGDRCIHYWGDVGQNYLDLCRRATVGNTSTGQAILKGLEAVMQGHYPDIQRRVPRAVAEREKNTGS